MTIALDHAAVRAAIGEIQRGGSTLDQECAAIARDVGALLNGWTGIAGAAFDETWEQWQRGAADVLDGLLTLGRLLEGVHEDLCRTDDASRASLDRIGARMPGRIRARLG